MLNGKRVRNERYREALGALINSIAFLGVMLRFGRI